MKRRWRTLVAGLVIAGSLAPVTLLMPAPVRAVGITVIDQRSESVPWEWLLKGDYAQTFTVGSTGTMTAVALWAFASQTATVEVAIHPLNASGFPTGFPLSTGYAGAGPTDAFVTFSLAHFSVSAGQHLAIVFHVLSKCAIRGDTANPYPGGMAQEYANGGWRGFQFVTTTDFAFRTYVTVQTAIPVPKMSLALTAQPTPQQTPQPTPPPTPQPTPQPTLASTPAPTVSSTPAGTSASASMIALVATAPPAGLESLAAVRPSESAAGGTSRPGDPAGPGNASDAGPPTILAAIAVVVVALVAVVGGLLFLFLRRRRRQAETAET